MTDSNIVSIAPALDSIESASESSQSRSIELVARSLVADDNIWAEFLKLQISEHTKRTYASALNDFLAKIAQRAKNVQLRFNPLLVMALSQD